MPPIVSCCLSYRNRLIADDALGVILLEYESLCSECGHRFDVNRYQQLVKRIRFSDQGTTALLPQKKHVERIELSFVRWNYRISCAGLSRMSKVCCFEN